MFGLSSLYLKLFGGLAALLIVVGLVLGLRHYRNLANDRADKLAAICQATREASGHPKLKCGDVPAQIQFMGEAVTALNNAIRTQNAAVASLGEQTKAQQAEAAKAVLNAQGRAKAAEATSARLTASSRSGGAPGAPCEPSEALKDAWR
jgi:hypothetical protein